jgi:hypothetical protein
VTTAELIQEQMRLSRWAEANTKAIMKAAQEAADAEHAYRFARAKAFVAAEGAMELRGALADIAAEREMLVRNQTRDHRDALVESGRNIRAQLQSLTAAFYAQKRDLELAV